MSRDYWEHRYQTGDMQWDKGEPAPGLVDFLATHPELNRGTVAVPGCGTGHDVRALVKAGFDGFGFDLAPSAIALAEEKTRLVGMFAGSSLPIFCTTNRRRSMTGYLSTPCSAPSSRCNAMNTSAPCGTGSNRVEIISP